MQLNWIRKYNPSKFRPHKVLYVANDAPTTNTKVSTETYHGEIYSILKGLGVDLTSTNSPLGLVNNGNKYDYVFSLLNRMPFNNSEVFISSYCEYLGLKYLGAQPNIRALCEDKHLTKIFAKSLSIPTSPWITLRCGHTIEMPDFEGPYFVKWRYGASSQEIHPDNVVFNYQDLKKRVQYFHQNDMDVIVERLLEGVSYTVPVVRTESLQVLPPVETESDSPYGIVTHEQARHRGKPLKRSLVKQGLQSDLLVNYSSTLFEQIQPADYARFDFKVDNSTNEICLLEINICCNLSSKSAFCISANSIGIEQSDLVSHILYQSLLRQGFNR